MLFCGASEGFMKPLMAFTQPFEKQQRSVKIKIQVFFSLLPGSGREGLISDCLNKTLMSNQISGVAKTPTQHLRWTALRQ